MSQAAGRELSAKIGQLEIQDWKRNLRADLTIIQALLDELPEGSWPSESRRRAWLRAATSCFDLMASDFPAPASAVGDGLAGDAQTPRQDPKDGK